MANTQAMTSSFRQDLFNGLHAFGTSVVRGTTAADSFKAALYLVTATQNGTTTAYATTGEVSGTGYTAGGTTIASWTAPTNTATTGGGAAWTTPSASFAWTTVTLGTAFDTVLIYNNTASGKNSVSVHTFGSQTVTAGNFTLTMPVNASGTALLQIS